MSSEAIGLVGVSKAYPGVNALTDVSFAVTRGRVHGFLGPNGAGKSTTMNIITGLLKESSGQVRLFGSETILTQRKSLIGYLPELPPIYPQMLVKDYLRFVASVHGLKGQQNFDAVAMAVEVCGLGNVRERMVGNLSKGYKQRVGLAQALVFKPQILILDEPTVGLDPVSVSEIRQLIKNLKGDHTVLLSSHLLHEISLVCDDITMINRGRVVASGTLEEIQQRFAGQARYRVRLEKFDETLREELKRDYGLEATRREQDWMFAAAESNEIQARQLLEKLVLAGCGVSAFFEEKNELEDIFKVAMKEQMQ